MAHCASVHRQTWNWQGLRQKSRKVCFRYTFNCVLWFRKFEQQLLMSWTAFHPKLLYVRREAWREGNHDICRNNRS